MNLCPDSSEDGTRCEKCPLNRLDAAQHSEAGQLLSRALNLEFALTAGITVTLDEFAADEFFAMQIIHEEREKLDRGEQSG